MDAAAVLGQTFNENKYISAIIEAALDALDDKTKMPVLIFKQI